VVERKKVGLALSGGGMRGLGHIGVLKVLEENKIPIDFIAGTSMGAVIGAIYSAESNAKKLEKESLNVKWRDLFDFTLSKSGFIKGDSIEEFLEDKLSHITFDDLKVPLYITALDIENGQEVVFHKGDVAKAVRASISIPGIFVPVENNGRTLVDGGVIDPIPIEILKNVGAEIIIAVNVNKVEAKKVIAQEEAIVKKSKKTIPSVIHTLLQTFEVMEIESCRAEIERGRADLLISPDIPILGWTDFSKTKEIIDAGEKATRDSLEELKKITAPHPLKDFLEGLKKDLNVVTLVKEVKKEVKEASKVNKAEPQTAP
jgi:NTE family protein